MIWLTFLAAFGWLFLSAAAVKALINAIVKQKYFPERYRFADFLLYVINAMLLAIYLYGSLIMMGFPIAIPTDNLIGILDDITGALGLASGPAAVWFIAKSISLHKEGRFRNSFLIQFAGVPLYILWSILAYFVIS